MKIYKKIIKEILDKGVLTENRTGVSTFSLFGRQYRYDMSEGFPILTTRKQDFSKIVGETLWYIKGCPTCDYLDQNNIKIWKQWTDEVTNSIGPLYPTQFRHHPTRGGEVDQLMTVIDGIKNNPFSRRHIISMWDIHNLPDEFISPIDNVREGKMALAPCLTLFQFKVYAMSLKEALSHKANTESVNELSMQSNSSNTSNVVEEVYQYLKSNPQLVSKHIKTNLLSLQLYQRSWDVGAAGGWNVSQSALLLHIVAHLTNTIADEFIHTIGDLHIYRDQIAALSEQFCREPYPLPRLVIDDVSDIDSLEIDNFKLIDYKHHGVVKIPVSV